MKRILIVTATLGFFPVQLAWAAPPSAAVLPPAAPATAPSNEVLAVAPVAPTQVTPATPPPAASVAPTQVTPPTAQPAASSASVEPSPYGPSVAEQSQQRNRERTEVDPNQPVTLLDPNADYAFGGMGGLGVMYTRIAGKNAPLVCGEGAIIIDHALTLGGGGCGVTRLLKAQDYSTSAYDADDRMTFGYGGAIGRYHFLSHQLVNVSVGALVGAGGVITGSWTAPSEDNEAKFADERHDAVFVFEPQVGAHVNITRWLRTGAVVGYRLVSGVETKGLSASDLSGITAGGQLQAGWF